MIDKMVELMENAADIAGSPSVQFGGVKYAFFWTDHAKQRAEEQGLDIEAATDLLLADLNEIENSKKTDIAVNSRYFCIRDLRNGFFAVCHLTPENKRIRVITYDGKHVLYPREGDVTYQFIKNDLLLRIWTRH